VAGPLDRHEAQLGGPFRGSALVAKIPQLYTNTRMSEVAANRLAVAAHRSQEYTRVDNRQSSCRLQCGLTSAWGETTAELFLRLATQQRIQPPSSIHPWSSGRQLAAVGDKHRRQAV
jgi:hypothetical protein